VQHDPGAVDDRADFVNEESGEDTVHLPQDGLRPRYFRLFAERGQLTPHHRDHYRTRQVNRAK
jgi:hypothetical protein